MATSRIRWLGNTPIKAGKYWWQPPAFASHFLVDVGKDGSFTCDTRMDHDDTSPIEWNVRTCGGLFSERVPDKGISGKSGLLEPCLANLDKNGNIDPNSPTVIKVGKWKFIPDIDEVS